jgi:hypothetical protein
MARIVRELHGQGWPEKRIMKLLGMEDEEVKRLLDHAGQPERIGSRNGGWNKSWKPDRNLKT